MTALAEIRRHVEPGALPPRVRFYALRRELAALPRVYAFALGVCLGVVLCAVALAAF